MPSNLQLAILTVPWFIVETSLPASAALHGARKKRMVSKQRNRARPNLVYCSPDDIPGSHGAMVDIGLGPTYGFSISAANSYELITSSCPD